VSATHTPGPWIAIADDDEDEEGWVVAADAALFDTIARPTSQPTVGEELANARLIAAAPDLLALARQYASECGECNGSGVIEVTVERTMPGCCGRPNDDGSCCGNPVPEVVPDVEQAPCPDCVEIRSVIAKAEGRS
jgi:hypothetical protein